MPKITWWTEPIASANTALIKDYSVVVTITSRFRTTTKTVSGQCLAAATERQMADETANAIERAYCGVASVQPGAVVFGEPHMGVLPAEGFYENGRRLSLPAFIEQGE